MLIQTMYVCMTRWATVPVALFCMYCWCVLIRILKEHNYILVYSTSRIELYICYHIVTIYNIFIKISKKFKTTQIVLLEYIVYEINEIVQLTLINNLIISFYQRYITTVFIINLQFKEMRHNMISFYT